MQYIKIKNLKERKALLDYLKKNDINAVFHYVPLHSAPAGVKFGRFDGVDNFTTKESERLIRLPMYYNMLSSDINNVIRNIHIFFGLK